MAQEVIDQFRDASNNQLVNAGDSTNTAIRVNVVAGGGTSTGGGGTQYKVTSSVGTASATGNVVLGISTDGTVFAPTAVPFANSTAIAVEIVDASGNQITAFGGGTTTVVGTVTTVPTGTQSVAQTGAPWSVSVSGTANVTGTVTTVGGASGPIQVVGSDGTATNVGFTGSNLSVPVVGTTTAVPSGTTTVSVLGGTTTATVSYLTSDPLDNDYALVVEDKRLRRLLEKIVIKSLDDEEIGRRYAVGRVGPAYLADQAWLEHRLERSGALVTADGHARYQEAVSRGNVFWTVVGGQTPSAANATCSGLILYNPINSKKLLSILNIGINYGGAKLANDTAVTLRLEAASTPNTTAPTGTTLANIWPALVTGNMAANVAIAYSTATFANAPAQSIGLACFQVIGTTGTAAAVAFSYPSFVDFGGIIAVAPGAFVNIGGVSNAALSMSMVWEEIPI